MLSKVKAKYIKSLQVKKYRKQEQSFVVEGEKGVTELLRSDFTTTTVCATKDFLARHGKSIRGGQVEVIEVIPSDLAAIGSVETNDSVLAVARMKANNRPVIAAGEYALVLDDIRDPGNLGTIIRTGDWYGIKHVIASEETADFYNPKVIRSTMGSFCRVNMFYTSLSEFLKDVKVPVYGAFLDGDDIHRMKFGSGGMIVIGNESNGISNDIEKYVTKKVTIPRFGNAESLNASIAAAIVLDNVRRA
ncbi:MAG TPA: RNA methyltransferase [Cyclobacteriaceae bacterium]|nr:RNA methyltransferase [Cyclobacteriaceae bacterium]